MTYTWISLVVLLNEDVLICIPAVLMAQWPVVKVIGLVLASVTIGTAKTSLDKLVLLHLSYSLCLCASCL